MKSGFGPILVLVASCAGPGGTEATRATSNPLAEAIRLAEARVEGSFVVGAEPDPSGPGTYCVGLLSGRRIRVLSVEMRSQEVIELYQIEPDDGFYGEVEEHMPSTKLDFARAMELAGRSVPGGSVREAHVGLAGDGAETTVSCYVTVRQGDRSLVKIVDLSTGEVKDDGDDVNPLGDEFDDPVAESGTVTRDFDDVRTGSLPEGWAVQSTGPQGMLATWEAVEGGSDASPGHALALTRANHASIETFNLCGTADLPFQNGTIELSMKPVSGVEDQGGGMVWRAKDKDNYYVCRANPLENNFRLYVVKDGERKQLADAPAEIATGEWHSIRVEHDGNRIACWLDGKKLLEAVDSTFLDVGGVGFWTKADAVTSFDDLRVSAPSDWKGGRGR